MRTKEIRAGVGKVRIGGGYMKEFGTDASGVMKPREVPVYITETF